MTVEVVADTEVDTKVLECAALSSWYELHSGDPNGVLLLDDS